MVNESLKGFLMASKDVWQGDPLSPFLFFIIGEALSRMLENAKHDNLFKSSYPRRENIVDTHLQFMDNTLIFVMVQRNS